MTEPLRARPGELSTTEVVEALDAGQRVLIAIEIAGTEKEVVLRRHDGVYYCDTPTTLHTHETESGIRTCLENQGYVSDEEDGR